MTNSRRDILQLGTVAAGMPAPGSAEAEKPGDVMETEIGVPRSTIQAVPA